MSDARRDGRVPGVGAAAGDGPEMTAFPRMEARSLIGRRYHLPDDFEGDPTIALVAFEQWQQARIDAWLPALDAALAALTTRGQDPRLYEVVVAPRSYLPARPLIDGSMAANIPSAPVRARTLTAYTDLPGVLAALGLPDAHDIALVLVDRFGRITWRARGAYDAGRAVALARAIDEAH